MRRVVITGMGLVSPIGNTVAEASDALKCGRSGIRVMEEWKRINGLKSLVAGRVPDGDPKRIPRNFRRTMGRVALLASFAALDAVADARLDAAAIPRERIGTAMGSTIGSSSSLEDFFRSYFDKGGFEGLEGTLFMRVMSHTVAANVAALLDCRGRLYAPCTACASSAQAVGMGFEAIRAGTEDIVICGGAEELHPTTVGVFDIVYAASRNFNDTPSKTPRPFDRDRDGLVTSEGGCAVVLEDYEHAVARGARLYAEVCGYATNCDARNMALSSVDGMYSCMKRALESAGIAPGDLSYINAHATGTTAGDASEAQATRMLVGERVPVSSTKGHTGHTLGACGAMEVLFCVLMMNDGFIAPTLNLENVSDDCAGVAHVQRVVPASLDFVLTNSFGFGGVNASLVLRKV